MLGEEAGVPQETPEAAQPVLVVGGEGEEAGDAGEATAVAAQQAIGQQTQVLQAGLAQAQGKELLDEGHECGVRSGRPPDSLCLCQRFWPQEVVLSTPSKWRGVRLKCT